MMARFRDEWLGDEIVRQEIQQDEENVVDPEVDALIQDNGHLELELVELPLEEPELVAPVLQDGGAMVVDDEHNPAPGGEDGDADEDGDEDGVEEDEEQGDEEQPEISRWNRGGDDDSDWSEGADDHGESDSESMRTSVGGGESDEER